MKKTLEDFKIYKILLKFKILFKKIKSFFSINKKQEIYILNTKKRISSFLFDKLALCSNYS